MQHVDQHEMKIPYSPPLILLMWELESRQPENN